jgi:hypothetical protein
MVIVDSWIGGRIKGVNDEIEGFGVLPDSIVKYGRTVKERLYALCMDGWDLLGFQDVDRC